MLVRALEPTAGSTRCARAAGSTTTGSSAPGPGRLCQALAVTGAHDGLPLDRPPFELLAAEAGVEIVAGPRVGITRAVELPVALRAGRLPLRQPDDSDA